MLSELGQALLPHYSYDRAVALFIIAIKTTVVYVFLVIGLRLGGKREMGEMNVYDLILIVVLGNAVQNAMVGNDDTVAGGLVSATTLLLLNGALAWSVERSPRLEHLLSGGAVVILRDGEPLRDVMQREGVTEEELMTALRAKGVERPDQARRCVLEVNGDISVIPREGQGGAAPRRRAFKGLHRS